MFKLDWKTALATALGVLTYCIGGVDKAMQALLLFMLLDYITGLASAMIRKQVSSYRSWSGVVRKTLSLFIVVVCHQVDLVFAVPNGATRTLAVVFLLATEGISVLENLGECGVQIPGFLRTILVALRDRSDKGQQPGQVTPPNPPPPAS